MTSTCGVAVHVVHLASALALARECQPGWDEPLGAGVANRVITGRSETVPRSGASRLDDKMADRDLERGMNVFSQSLTASPRPTGRNLVQQKRGPLPAVTGDGVSLGKQIELADPINTFGAELANRSARRPTMAPSPSDHRVPVVMDLSS
jgi:hypothetical protein